MLAVAGTASLRGVGFLLSKQVSNHQPQKRRTNLSGVVDRHTIGPGPPARLDWRPACVAACRRHMHMRAWLGAACTHERRCAGHAPLLHLA
jgi:hypothetical protein